MDKGAYQAAIDDPAQLNVSGVYRSRIGLPYVWVRAAGVTITARMGVTPGMARWLGTRRAQQIARVAERHHGKDQH